MTQLQRPLYYSAAAQDLRNKGAIILKGDLDDSDSLERAVKDVQLACQLYIQLAPTN